MRLTVVFCICTLPVFADDQPSLSPQTIESTDYIMGTLMSPYCPGRLLKDCPSGQAFQLKEKISARLEAGESLEVVTNDLINTFGDEIRAAPQAKGFGLLAWLMPGVFLLCGGIFSFLWLRSRRNKEELEIVPLSAEMEKKLNAELTLKRQ